MKMNPIVLFALAGSLFLASACVVAPPQDAAGGDVIRIGVNAELTGDIPKVGEGTKFAAEMWLEDIQAAGGLEVGGKMYQVELVIEDNEAQAESAATVATKLITQDNEIALIVPQAHELGWDAPIIGSDSWGSAELTSLCGDDCDGLFFSTRYAAAGATGATKEFIDRYNAKYGYVPDDVGALTWDTMLLDEPSMGLARC